MIKYKLIDRYRARTASPPGDARIAQLTLAYHDIHRGRGLYYLLEKRGAVARVTTDLKIFEAKSVPPQNTRARLRGEFIRKAQERRRDFTVDWVHLKRRPGLVVQLQVHPVDGEVAAPLLGLADELAAQPGPRGLRRHATWPRRS